MAVLLCSKPGNVRADSAWLMLPRCFCTSIIARASRGFAASITHKGWDLRVNITSHPGIPWIYLASYLPHLFCRLIRR